MGRGFTISCDVLRYMLFYLNTLVQRPPIIQAYCYAGREGRGKQDDYIYVQLYGFSTSQVGIHGWTPRSSTVQHITTKTKASSISVYSKRGLLKNAYKYRHVYREFSFFPDARISMFEQPRKSVISIQLCNSVRWSTFRYLHTMRSQTRMLKRTAAPNILRSDENRRFKFESTRQRTATKRIQ